MPSLIPLLSSSSNAASSAPVSAKKAAKKLRRKNPPPSLSTNHQKLPSSAGSSTYDLPKSRPSSSRSFHNIASGDGWFASLQNPLPTPLPTPHPTTSTNGRRKSGPNVDHRSPEEFPFRPMTPPESGSPELGYQTPQKHHHHHSLPLSGPSAYNTPLTLSRQSSFPIQQTLVSPPSKIVKGRSPDAFKAFSYDSYSNMPVSPPPQSPPANSIPPTYLGTAQYPNNLIQQPATPQRAQTFPAPLNTNLAPPTALQLSQMGRTPNGSPILPPLPSFQSGGFGFDLPNTNNDNRFMQSNTGRQRYQQASPPLPSPGPPPLPERRRPTVSTESGMHSYMLDSPSMESPLVQSPGDYIFHALTAEEPITLPSSAEQTPEPSPQVNSTEFSQPPAKGRVRRKSDAVSTFLGGWKLAMMGGSHSSSTVNNDKSISSSESDAPPVGVGDGGGWIHRRKGSFSSTRPPSREKSKHGAYAQEYKEFRAQKQAEGAPSKASSKASSKRSSKDSAGTSPVEGTGVSAILGGLSAKEKAKGTEARQKSSEGGGVWAVSVHPVGVEPTKIEASEVVSLDMAVRQMNLLEEQLSKGRPLSPPDSRDGEKPAPVGTGESDKGYHAGSEYSQTDTTLSTPQNSRQNSAQNSARNSGTSSPAGSINQKSQLHSSPRSPLAKQTTVDKGKSRSPLRNEIDSDSVSSGGEEKERERKKSPRHPANSEFSLGKIKNTSTGLGDPSSGLRPPTPPKPIAKLFVICCRCKYWHDLPSVMYRGMVENGGATRCPYCLHGMEVSCCSGYVLCFLPLLLSGTQR